MGFSWGPRTVLGFFSLIPSRSILARGGGWCTVKTEKEEVWCACFQWQASLATVGNPRGDPGPSAERRCRCTGWILSEWRVVTGTCFAPLLVEGATSCTAGWVRVDPFEKSSRVESVPRASTVRRRPWTSALGEARWGILIWRRALSVSL
ncbi:hypothetical protein AVEN_93458-1 [Araneus ventricosus]|uniref:Secreted protein n=1 Tax=Araneus ventricosus TaxID=182803 RepID=A0A4Y2APC9_ARAVE|nr:hypothetical protein AVEN_93458-1 [Araneus ventricosus]